MRTGKIYTKFYSGEFSPWLLGQADLNSYQYGLEKLYNGYVQKYGPLSRRTGTRLISVLGEANKVGNCRLVPFTVNEDTIYVLEFTDKLMRVITPDGAYVTNEDGSIYSLDTPFTEDTLFTFHYAQSSDVMFIVHGSIFPRQLSHYGPTKWTIDEMDIKDGPYFSENAEESKTMQIVEIGESEHEEITDNSDINKKMDTLKSGGFVHIVANYEAFSTKDVNRLFRIKNGNTWTWLKFTDFISPTTMKAQLKSFARVEYEKDTTTWKTSYSWRLGSWCTAAGFPRAVTFHQERLWLGGSTTQPQTVWGSVSASFDNFAPTDEIGDVLDDNAITVAMLSDESNIIQWLKSDTVLNVGTLGAEFKVFTYDSESVLTPSTTQSARVTSLGSESIEPISMPRGTVFVQRSGRKLRHAIFSASLAEDETPIDMNIWAPHIAERGVSHMAYQNEPNGIIWVCTNDGGLASLTYDEEQRVMGWGRHKIAGKNSVVHHVCTIPVKSALQYRLFLVVDRDVNGKRIRCVEYMTNDPIAVTDQTDMIYTDYSYHKEKYFTINKLRYDPEIAELIVYLEDDGKENVLTRAGNVTNGIPLPANGVRAKIAKYSYEEPDIPGVDYTQARHLSDVINNRVFTLEYLDTNRYKLKSHYGSSLPEEFYDCYNDIVDAGILRLCFDTVEGLENWESEEVQIYADGAVLPNDFVNNGKIELGNDYACVTIGLGYRTIVKTLPVSIATQTNEATDMWNVKIISAFIKLYRSLGFKYGIDGEDLSVEPFRKTKEQMDKPTPLFTGTKEVTVGDVTENKGQIVLIQDQPLPLNVLSMRLKLDVNDI